MLAPGLVLQDRYRIVRQLGKGGMGAVYEAQHVKLGHTVAVKETFFSEDHLTKAFEREARLLAGLSHPALPKVSDYFSQDSGHFLVMEFIPGKDLSAYLAEHGTALPLQQVLHWADHLLDALEYLHNQQPPVIHRDIKPANLKVTAEGRIFLLDFGLAKGLHTQMSQVPGSSGASVQAYTPGYAPVEQMQGSGTDARSDVFSLSATLYHLMTGAPPVDALTRAMKVAKRLPDPLPLASEINWMIPVSVARVLQQALDLDEDLRPTTAADFRRMLRQASTGSIEQPGTVLVAGDATNPGASFHNDVTRQASQPINWSESQTVVDPSKSVPPVMSPPESFQTRPVAPPPAHPTLPPTIHISPTEPERPAPESSKKWRLPVLALVMLVLVVGVIGARMIWQARKNNLASSSAPTQAEKKNKPPTPSPKKNDETPMVVATPLSPTFTNRIGMEFVLISPGSFLMGSPESEADRETDEGPQHKVTISQPFYLGKYEVTQAEWKVVMEDNPSEFPGERLPVDSISWDDCQEFLKKLNARNDGYTYRLPSEAEWEYACRAGSKTPFSFGEKVTMKQVNFSGNFPYGDDPETDGQGKPVSVGSYPANAWGLYEMHGNVREWCQDWLQVDYTDAPTDGRPWVSGPETQYRVLRGGAWNVNARDCRSATRSGNTPDATDNSYGLRVVAEKVEKN